MAKPKMPKRVYVYEVEDRDVTYFACDPDLDAVAPEVGEKRIVGAYALVETVEITTKPEVKRI